MGKKRQSIRMSGKEEEEEEEEKEEKEEDGIWSDTLRSLST